MGKKKITSSTVSMNDSIVSVFNQLVNKYQEKESINNYSQKTMMLDLLYFLGISINSEQYKNHDGFQKFKKHLKEDIL